MTISTQVATKAITSVRLNRRSRRYRYERHKGISTNGYHFANVAMPRLTPVATSRPFCRYQKPNSTNRLATISKRLMVK